MFTLYSLFVIFCALSFLLLSYKVINLCRYILAARSSGLPYVVSPALETELWGYLLTPLLRKVYHEHLLKGQGWPEWCRFLIKDWGWEDKRRAHEKYGDVFLVVSPEGIICYSSDAALNHEVFTRKTEFLKPRDKYVLLEPFGPNVATTEGKTYQFHVRISAAPFSDTSGVNSLVWTETLTQTRKIMQTWENLTVNKREVDVNALTLAVITWAACGRQAGGTGKLPSGYILSFLDSFHETTKYLIPILLAPTWLLRTGPLSQAALAHSQLDKYLRQMVREEDAKIRKDNQYESSKARGNLLTSLLRMSAAVAASENPVEQKQGSKKTAFSEDEVMGNLWIYLLAGYEASSNGIRYGLITLALYPEFQDKVIAEIDRVYEEAAAEGRSELNYGVDFEKLEYTYGFMYETFRLFPGNAMITKMVHNPTTVNVSTRSVNELGKSSHVLPAGCRVYMNTAATHYSPRYWPAPETLDPMRWTAPKTFTSDSKATTASDKSRQMRGTFLSFSDGSRACLGRKFAQAEYMAFLVALLKEYRVILGEGMNEDDVKKDLFWRCAGSITLAALDTIKVGFVKRPA